MYVPLESLNSIPRAVLETGTISSAPRRVGLRAGPLTLFLEKGNLRHIKHGNTDIIRMIYPAVRDSSWLTIEPRVTREEIDVRADSFSIRLECIYQEGGIHFVANYTYKGTPDGEIECRMEGIALEGFYKNRIGFCVHHPVEECAGKPCTIVHQGKEQEQLLFPELVSPHQPFKNIEAMEWSPAPDINARLGFVGDTFETEDQRNWTDASYKTYSTPLDLPYPAWVEKGEKIVQSVRLSMPRLPRVHTPVVLRENQPVEFTIGDALPHLPPSIGVGRSTRPGLLSVDEIAFLKETRFDHYRVDLCLSEPGWETLYKEAVLESTDLGYPLELALFLDEQHEPRLQSFISLTQKLGAWIKRIIVLEEGRHCTTASLFGRLRNTIESILPGIELVTGTNANFAQLNRERPNPGIADFISFAIHPQEHASDNLSLVENLQAQSYAIESAKAFAGNAGVVVSPVTIQRRFNANTSTRELPWTQPGPPPQVDPRLLSHFGAGWTIGSLKYILESGIHSVTYHEAVGERGLFMGDRESRWSGYFPAPIGSIFPVHRVFKTLLDLSPFQVITSRSSSPLEVNGFAVKSAGITRVFLANLTGREVNVDIIPGVRTEEPSIHIEHVSLTNLTSNWIAPTLTRIKLPAYYTLIALFYGPDQFNG